MRVITGTARGRRLGELKGMETRPTAGKVKEGIFSALQFDIEGRRVLDLFAGTGQMGIEALSRGAESCVFVDRRADAVKLVRENLEVCDLTDRAQVFCADAMGFLASNRARFDLVFLDPPYADDILERSMEHIVKFDILAPGGIIVAECPAEKTIPAPGEPCGLYREYRYGKIKVTVFRRDEKEQI
ncbi:MAG: 16S rRNA (guanine(966)-N(2))-methyltransferase RsmD [Oscillospiraceae bacterium]|nr:16S rRNA (guanine(966)-N(2))-methyltransferase RsmD [Oscillospiraceae bacterium]